MRVAEPAGLSIFSRPKGDVEFLAGGKRQDGGFEVGYEIRHGVNEEGCREREWEKWERDRKGNEKKRRPEMRRLKTDTVVQVSAHRDIDDPPGGSGRSLSMPAVETEDVSPAKSTSPSPSPLPQEPQHQGNLIETRTADVDEEVQVQDFATNLAVVPSSVDAGQARETGKDGEEAEDADNDPDDDDDDDDDDDISPGGHHHSPGFARRLRRARRDVRRGVRSRAGVGGAEIAAGREGEELKEEREEEQEEYGLAEVFERFRLWKWSGQ